MPEAGRETGIYGRSFGQPPVEHAILAVAGPQHAVIELDQLSALGLSQSAVHKRAATGRLHRVYTRVYSLVPPPLLTGKGRWMAAVLACGPGAALSYASAAALLELRRSDAVYIDVTVPADRVASTRESGSIVRPP